MGQLTNLYVSESYQGLLKLTDSTTGLTSSLQTIQDGLGGNSPLQMSLTAVNISGSFTVNGSPITGSAVDTGSFATTGSNTFIGSQIIEGNLSFPSNSFVSTDNVSGALYFSSLNGGTLYINADGGEGNVNVGHNGWTGKLNVTGSLGVTNIQGTGSLFLQPNQTDARYLEVYNTSPTDTHITGSGGQIFLGDDQTYVKVDNYGSVERIDIVAGNELVVSSSVINVSGSLYQSGTFYPGVIDWVNSSIVQNTGSYILTVNTQGITEYDTYANVAIALGQYSSSGSSGTSGTSGTSGQAGSSGTSGTSGDSGSSGTSGSSGSSGTSGVAGSSGTSGTAGTSGTSGDSLFALTGSVWNTTNNVGITGSLTVRSGSLSTISNNTTVNTDLYLTSSQAGQVNIIKGWSENPAAGGPGATQANYTGSLRITGSNNIVSLPQLRATGNGGGVDQQGYISGSDNTINGNSSGIYLNTGSLLFPKLTSNILGNGSSILMNFTTSSLAGGHPIILNNTLFGGSLTINSNSGSVQSVAGNIVNNGGVTSTQNFVTNQRPSISSNIVNGTSVTLNHISSSITYSSNLNNSPVTINNHVSSSNITNNNVSFGNNTFLGGNNATGHAIWVSGSQSSNIARNFNNNLIGGNNNIISSSFVSSSNSNLVSSIIYGNNLAVSASHTTGTNGGSAFFGRFNATGSNQEDAQSVVFAVGTGTAVGSRRTGFLIDSGSNVYITGSVNISGSNHQIIGNTVITGSLNVSGAMTLGFNDGTDNITSIGFGAGVTLYRNANKYTTAIGEFSGTNTKFANGTNNILLGGFNSQFATGSQNFLVVPSGGNFKSGSINIIIGNTENITSGSQNILIGQMPSSLGPQVDAHFVVKSQSESNSYLFKSGSGANVPIQIGFPVQVTGSLNVNGNTTVTGSLRLSGSANPELIVIGETQMTGSLLVTGDVLFASGSNKTMGTFVLNGGNPGTATVSNSLVSATSLIFLTKQTNTNSGNGTVSVTSKGSGTFNVTSDHNGDADTVAYLIINPS